VVGGGETRQESVRLALRAVAEDVKVVACHDAARPFASPALFGAVIEAVGDGAAGAVPVVAVADTIKRARDGWVVGTEVREELAAAQTPQAFATPVLREAHERAAAQGVAFTDDAALVEWAGGRVRTVPGEPANIKVTTPEDLARAEAVEAAAGGKRMPRVGVGFDMHPRDDERPLRLGGIEFAGEPGLGGHSDADVICHALADAALGAAALGDLGQHFPDTDAAYAGIGGLDLLGRVIRLVAAEGLRMASCDVTFVGERPAIGPRREDIRGALAAALGLDPGRVSVKATRPEGLGLSGDGAACLAVAVLEPA
jgi:2-C-methyl-D-erythritol 4-phosphate cytidylyltransferase/2-C-methyl-D-erythritol 2,4-cyclodiphosphate synthase